MPLICRTKLHTRLYMNNCFTPSTNLRIKSVLIFITLDALCLNELSLYMTLRALTQFFLQPSIRSCIPYQPKKWDRHFPHCLPFANQHQPSPT